ncbi:MAG: phage major capsid protein, partial [Bryobacteraceae bacterium]|nr:phage major capsid protein [Bryobacteraceae bacterium]
MQHNAYEQVVTKHLELTGLVSSIASEGRTPTDQEKQRIETLRGEVETIQKSWESDGRAAFLASLQTNQPKATSGPLVLKAEQRFADVVKSQYPAEWQNLSLGRFLKGYVTGDWAGAELEMKAMASTPASAGGVLIPAVLGARVIDLARNVAVLTRAGAQVVPMTSNNLKLARQTADAAVGWYGEGADISETDATFDSVDFATKKMACLVRVSNELIEDAANFETVLEAAIAAAM